MPSPRKRSTLDVTADNYRAIKERRLKRSEGKAEGERLAKRAQKEAYKNADPNWRAAVEAIITTFSYGQREFTTDDIWEELEIQFPTVKTSENRAMGPILKACQNKGLCVPTDRYQKTSRPIGHGRPVRIWKSY